MVGEKTFETRNLFKKFATGELVLNDVNLEIFKGEIFGVIGKSGAGKSTLIRCLNYLETPTSGEVFFKNRPLSSAARKDLNKIRQSIGMIFQQFNLLMQRNSIENVCFPMEIAGIKRAEARKRAEKLLSLVNLSDKIKSYPSKLSGGQRQRVAIARAIAMEPAALLCDEPTSALDPETTDDILSLLKDLNARLGITIVIITHEARVVEAICDRVAAIENGKIIDVSSQGIGS